jgi:salicylate hydroxylase
MAEEPEKTISIGVVGAGIGGLAAALSLLRAGFDIHVFEQARALREVGAGIQVSPNASRILHRLGLADELAAMGVRPDAFHQRRWDDGRTLLRTPLGDTVVEAFSFPHYQMHRADLLNALIRKLPAHRIHLGHRLMGFVDRGRRVQATFENGVEIEVDLLVGADGIHSIVRSIMLGAATPHFTGCVAYRGLVPADRLKHLDLEVTAEIWMGPGAWALFDRAPLERWSTGRVTLLGDSCHPMLPFMAQGAAQALEDGATLTACLIREADVPTALRLYEHVRLPRASRMQAMSATNKTRFHLPDGPEQEERDAVMASGSTDFSIKAVAWIYRHDAGRLEPAV